MRVIHVLNHFLPYQVAGTEVYVWALCKQLQANDCAVSVLIPNYESTESVSYEHDGIPVFKYAEPSKPDRALILGQKVSNGLVNFQKYIETQKPDIVHFHEIAGSNGISVAHLEAVKKSGFKVVYTMHLANATCNTGNLMFAQKELCDGVISISKCSYCSLQRRLNSSWKARVIHSISLLLYRLNINLQKINSPIATILSYPTHIKNLTTRLTRIQKACDAIVPITNWYAAILNKNGVEPAKMQTVLQAIPTAPSSITVEEESVVTTSLPLKLIFIGRINHLKGIPILLSVCKRFPPSALELNIYGATDDDAFLQACKDLTSENHNIKWRGKLSQQEVVSTIAQHHALILPSIFSEMSPLVIQEAFAAGVPVIGSNVSGIAEQVKDNINGRLFLYKDKQSLKEVLAHIIDNMQLINEYRSNIPGVRTFNVIGEEVLKIYQSLN